MLSSGPAGAELLLTGVMTGTDEEMVIAQLIERLVERFPTVAREVVEDVVDDALAHFGGAPIRDFIPLLVEHEAVETLWLLNESGD